MPRLAAAARFVLAEFGPLIVALTLGVKPAIAGSLVAIQALDAEPARKTTLHRGFRQGGGDERKGQRHPNRALALAFADGEQLDGLGGVE